MCEPYISPVSYPVYKFLHEEPLDLRVDPLALAGAAATRRAIRSTRTRRSRRCCSGAGGGRSRQAFPALAITRVQHLSGFSCPASGGFSHRPFLPWALWSLLHRIDARLPSALMRWMAFRMLVVIERA